MLEQALSTAESHPAILVAVLAWLLVCLSTQVGLQSLTLIMGQTSIISEGELHFVFLCIFFS